VILTKISKNLKGVALLHNFRGPHFALSHVGRRLVGGEDEERVFVFVFEFVDLCVELVEGLHIPQVETDAYRGID
jgi:hypothetical protein